MLRHVHGVLGTLMYAENCYIVEYDDVRDQIRFLYFADQVDDFVADPSQSHDASEMPRSLTVALLRLASRSVAPRASCWRRCGGAGARPAARPESLDWLGVPMLRDGRVCGAIVVQSYEQAARYGEAERALLGFVAQHADRDGPAPGAGAAGTAGGAAHAGTAARQSQPAG
jgi:hypothetical protein